LDAQGALPADALKSGHEVEEQRWLVNGDRSPLAAIDLRWRLETAHGPAMAEVQNKSEGMLAAAYEVSLKSKQQHRRRLPQARKTA